MYNVELSKQAKKFIDKQDKTTKKRLFDAILQIRENPYNVSNVKKLRGKKYTRKRIGDFRIAYEVYDDIVLIYIVMIDNRGQIYNRL